MKEIMAIIRLNMINKTKDALLKEGFPSITCRKVLGRGKKKVDFSLIDVISQNVMESPRLAEELSEGHRLIPKRLLTMVVKDEDVKKVVDTIMSVNSTGNPGDGKIFVLPVMEVIRVRTGETGETAI
ncbi:MAG: nitrogen regulatory protein 2 [Petroclostridium sp.]|jgi:nitrogen regulatory protein PII 2|uniref:P-II family nitrogen regulator n=1 Tax=Petroclostridium xylanilyticum TaxID=1792311 RepID=UPI000B99BAF1|nr:P-II family nitrogen regulator [Petroclostridium xylanilyticum]MBZ4645941.1 nitrogen regulatory protein [Clostridia bacterium]MDK2810762.1 nitrogen regulatory protein 2 [Petroclostridium sp.]